MKSLLKLSFICLLTFFATNMMQAQCPNLSMTGQKISENATSVTYRFTVTSNNPATILRIDGIATCYNATSCTGTQTFQKVCGQPSANVINCSAFKSNCSALRDGCVVVVNPQLSGCP